MRRTITSAILSFMMIPQAYGACNKSIKLKFIKTSVWQCEDGTISYSQGDRYVNGKDKKNDYEGMCGPTAAANVFHAYCEKLFIEPTKISGKYFDDITPGVRPDTMEYGLNKMFNNNSECISGEWKYYYSTNRWNFLNSLTRELNSKYTYLTRTRKDGTKVKRAPVPVLISKKSDAKVLHWVTVVDIIGYSDDDLEDYESKECKVIYNDMGSQHTATCANFVKYSHQVDNNTFTRWMPEYIHIVFEPSAFYKAAHSAKEFAIQAGKKRSEKIKNLNSRK